MPSPVFCQIHSEGAHPHLPFNVSRRVRHPTRHRRRRSVAPAPPATASPAMNSRRLIHPSRKEPKASIRSAAIASLSPQMSGAEVRFELQFAPCRRRAYRGRARSRFRARLSLPGTSCGSGKQGWLLRRRSVRGLNRSPDVARRAFRPSTHLCWECHGYCLTSGHPPSSSGRKA